MGTICELFLEREKQIGNLNKRGRDSRKKFSRELHSVFTYFIIKMVKW